MEYRCNNCGHHLSKDNIVKSLEDYGAYNAEDMYEDNTIEDEAGVVFCCPSFTWEEGCKGYSKDDRELPAYWRTA